MGQSDVFDVFKYIQIMLQITGIWSKPDATVFYKIKGFVSYLLSVVFNVLAFIEIYSTFNGVESVSYSLFVNVALVFYLPKAAIFFYHRHEFYRILKHLKDPVLKTYDDDLDFYVAEKIGIFTKLQLVFQTLCGVTVFLVFLIPFFSEDFKAELPIPFPFDLKHQPSAVYAFFWSLQFYILTLSAVNNSSLDILACSFMGIASAQLEILREKLKRVAHMSFMDTKNEDRYFAVYGETDKEVLRKIKNCVQHHGVIEKLINSVESTFTFMFLAQFLSSVTVICVTEFTFILVPLASAQFGLSFLFFGCVTLQVAMYCAFGDDVTAQSSKLGEACYMSEWNNCELSVRKSLMIIMERSKRPYVLTAGKFAPLTLNSFVMILKSSFSYFAVLQKLYDKSNSNY